jgi:hypothetical protein
MRAGELPPTYLSRLRRTDQSKTYLPSALTQTKGAAEVSPPFVEPTMNLGDFDGGRPRGAVVAESFECVCALAPRQLRQSSTSSSLLSRTINHL